MRSAITERPMRMPSGTPTTTAMALPSRKALAVIHSALAKLGVGTISMMRATMADSGGMMKLAPVWPTISHSVAQMISEQNSGMRTLTPKMLRVMALAQSRYFFRPCQISRTEEHTSELQSLMRIPYAVLCLKKKNDTETYNLI